MKKHIKSSLLIVFLATPLLGRAAGIPTIDVANILQTTISALESVQQTANQIEQIANQIDQFNKLQEQLDQQFAQFESITGDYGLSDLLNGPNQQAARRAIPTSWQETLALLESGSAPGHQQDFLNAAVRAQEELQTYQPGDIYEDVDAEIAQKRIADANSAFAQFGVGEGNYNEADRRTETVEGLIGSIAAQNDLKAARQFFADGLEIRKTLAANDPSNAGYQRDVAVSHVKLAQLGGNERAGVLEIGLWSI